jgi:FeS assembly protein IscX
MLSWESSYEIVLALQATYPNIQIESVSLEALNTMIVALPDFGDDPSLVNDGILMDILREWYEESNS